MLRRALPVSAKTMNRNTELAEPAVVTSHPSFGEAFRFWLKLGFISFGGPTGQIAIMQTELVEKKKLDQSVAISPCAEFLHASARPGSATASHLYWLALA